MNLPGLIIGIALVVIGVALVRIGRTLDDIKHQVYRDADKTGDDE